MNDAEQKIITKLFDNLYERIGNGEIDEPNDDEVVTALLVLTETDDYLTFGPYYFDDWDCANIGKSFRMSILGGWLLDKNPLLSSTDIKATYMCAFDGVKTIHTCRVDSSAIFPRLVESLF